MILWLNRKAKALAVRLNGGVHPKHDLPERFGSYWYVHHVPMGSAIVDVGCGNGRHLLRVADRGDVLVGLDMDLRALAMAGVDSAERGLIVHWLQHDVTLPWPCSTRGYEVVLMLDILEHLETRARLAVLAQAGRVLAPSGVLILAVPNGYTWWKRLLRLVGADSRSDPDHRIEYSVSELAMELADAGFGITECPPSVIDMPLVGLLDVLGAIWPWPYWWATWCRLRLGDWSRENAVGFNVVARRRAKPWQEKQDRQ